MIYLDNAASTQPYPEVISEMQHVLQNCYGNPASLHEQGRRTRVIIENSRKKIAQLIRVAPSEIFFTSGGTEASNWVINACIHKYNVKHIITTAAEHPAVLKPVRQAALTFGIKISYLPLKKDGLFEMEALESLLHKDPHTLVCLMHANNETGAMLPLKNVSALCESYNAIFMSDMVQTFGKYPIDWSSTKVDFATASAHKFHGPKGVGFLYINSNRPVDAYILGGGQERNRRAGTENIAGIAGMAKAFEMAHQNMSQKIAYVESLKNYMLERLHAIKEIDFNSPLDSKGLYTIVNIALPARSGMEMIIQNLDIAGIAASGGSACASGSQSTSPVLEAMGTDLSRQAIRFSFSTFNTKTEIDKVVDTLLALLK